MMTGGQMNGVTAEKLGAGWREGGREGGVRGRGVGRNGGWEGGQMDDLGVGVAMGYWWGVEG